ncbi:acetyltransferase, partial [Aureobasidium pullulans]
MASPDLSLFPPTLLPTSASSSLPKPYTIRPLHRTDHAHGYLTCLSSLTWIGEISAAQFEQRFDWMKTKGKEWYYCIVIDDGEKIIGAATMILDRKFIQNFTTIAHVEEVSISSSHQKQ